MTVEIFLLGASSDAAESVGAVLSLLPREVPVPVVVVVPEREPSDELCFRLAQYSPLPVEEPEDKDEILPGRVYLAPAGYHLLVDRGTFVLSREAPINRQRPSFAPLFETAADSYGDAAAGMILTGSVDSCWESVAMLRASGGIGAIGWVSGEAAAPTDVHGVPVIKHDAVNPWIMEMCTSHSLMRGRP